MQMSTVIGFVFVGLAVCVSTGYTLPTPNEELNDEYRQQRKYNDDVRGNNVDVRKYNDEVTNGDVTNNVERQLDAIGGGNILRNLDGLGGGNLIRQTRRPGLDSLSGGGFGVSKRLDSLGGDFFGNQKRNFDEIDRSGFNSFVKKNFDEIDHGGFDSFVKRNFDEIDRVGFSGFIKRSIPELVARYYENKVHH